MPSKIHLDYAVYPQLLPQCTSLFFQAIKEKGGSLSSPYRETLFLQKEYTLTLASLLSILELNEGDLFIPTSGVQETMLNLLFSHYFHTVRETGKNHFLILASENKPIFSALSHLENLGCATTSLSLNKEGILDAFLLKNALKPRSSFLSLSVANPLTGVIQPLEEIGELCKEKGIFLHLEISSLIANSHLSLSELPWDALSFDTEQLGCPPGSGALIFRRSTPFYPFRTSSLNLPALLAVKEAVQYAVDHKDVMTTETARLRHKLEKEIKQALPDTRILFENRLRLPHLSTLYFPGIYNEALLFMLFKQGVFPSIGGGNRPLLSSILESCQYSKEIAHSSLNFSLSSQTTEQEIETALYAVIDCVKKLHKLSLKC